MISAATYVTREEVKAALDVADTARSNDRVDRAIESATENVDGCLRRRFIPWSGTRYFPWPERNMSTPWRLWLDADELISITSLTAGGVTIAVGDRFLEPANAGPPFDRIELDRSSSAVFTAGPTPQRDVAAAGTFGYRDDQELVGALGGTLAADVTATASVTWTTPRVGVGSLLTIDAERLLVTDRSMVDSGQNLVTPMTSSASAVTVAVTDGTAFSVEEILLLDSERMRVVDIAGNNLTVKRAYDGSVLATHSGSDIYTLTGVTLGRAQAGTTLASHSAAASITRLVIPSLVRDLALAYAINQLLQEGAGYARVAGTGDNQSEVSGRGIYAIERDALERHGRQLFKGAV